LGKYNIKISAIESLGMCELKHHKLWFDEDCLRFLDERTQWLQVPNQSNVNFIKNIRHEASRHFRNKKKEYLKAKLD
jgi:predicted Fe-S protein YdhL (DUF1289 family)